MLKVIGDSETAFAGRRVTVLKDPVETLNGKRFMYETVKVTDAVAILPVERDGIILVGNYRHPVGKVIYEVPAGKLEAEDVDPLSRAKAELREEVGFAASNWKALGIFYPSPGILTERIHFFRASGLSFVGQQLEDSELGMDVIRKTPIQVAEWLNSGEAIDMKTAYLLRLYLASLQNSGH